MPLRRGPGNSARRNPSTSWTASAPRSAWIPAAVPRGGEGLLTPRRTREPVNEEWISDKTRHVVDGLRTQRLDRPFIRENGKLRAASWRDAFAAIAAKDSRTGGKRTG